MTVQIPERTHEQRMSALERANHVRLANAELKRQIAKGKVDWKDVLRAPSDEAKSMQIAHLMMAVPRFGDARVDHVLKRTTIPPTKPIGKLTASQVEQVIGAASGTVDAKQHPLQVELRRLRNELWSRDRELADLRDELRRLRTERLAFGRVAA